MESGRAADTEGDQARRVDMGRGRRGRQCEAGGRGVMWRGREGRGAPSALGRHFLSLSVIMYADVFMEDVICTSN